MKKTRRLLELEAAAVEVSSAMRRYSESSRAALGGMTKDEAGVILGTNTFLAAVMSTVPDRSLIFKATLPIHPMIEGV